jgi:hypothetical protein
MADSIVRLKVESSEYDQKLKRAAEGLQRYSDKCREVGGTLEVVEKDTLEYVRALGQMETTSKTATGKLAEMKKAFVELSVQYNKLTDDEKKSPFGQALSGSLDQLKVRINQSKTEIDSVNQSLNGTDGLTGALDAVAGKFGLSIDQITKFGGVVGVATTAMKVAKDAFFQSESGIDEWGRTVEGAKGAYNTFLDTLNNGNWSGFFDNLSKAIRGGRDLYDVFDRLGSIKSNNAAAIAIAQREIAELRLAKQQGENVDAKLKAATERLHILQNQGVSAGMNAGKQSAFQTIRSGVNSVGGAGVNDATINYAIERIMKNGQSEFDKYRYNRDTLKQRGMVTKTQTIQDSQGGTYERQYKVFDINALTKEQQKQYALAQAITEGETRIQQGISVYAQAVSEGASSAREAFKGNRYALQGSSGGGGGIGIKTDNGEDFNQKVMNQWLAASAKSELNAGSLMPTDSGPSEIWQKITQGAKESESSIQDLIRAFEQLNQSEGVIGKTADKTAKGTANSWSLAASSVSAMGSALQSIDDPGAKIMGIIGQAIANIALGFAQASAAPATTAAGIWGWIAAAVGGTATMISTIAAIHSATGYSEGGEIKGRTFSGDQIPAMLNAGEIVLNRAQAGNLASQFQGVGMSNVNWQIRIKGEDMYLTASTSQQRRGRGRIVTSNRQRN